MAWGDVYSQSCHAKDICTSIFVIGTNTWQIKIENESLCQQLTKMTSTSFPNVTLSSEFSLFAAKTTPEII